MIAVESKLALDAVYNGGDLVKPSIHLSATRALTSPTITQSPHQYVDQGQCLSNCMNLDVCDKYFVGTETEHVTAGGCSLDTSGIGLNENGLCAFQNPTKRVVDLDSGEDYGTPVFSLTSPLGQTVEVFSNCVSGTCMCAYSIGDIASQLKPCRFASIICSKDQDFHDKYLELLWLVTDGCPIVDGPMEAYECSNYSSITCAENSGKMSSIIDRELGEGMISLVESKPVCVHALGAVPKSSGGIRHITDCSRPEGKAINYNCDSLLQEFTFKSVSDVTEMLDMGDYMCVVDIKAAYRAVPVRNDHRKYQGFSWVYEGKKCWFVDNRMCFGNRLGPMYFNFLSTFIYDILNAEGFRVVNYLDDFIAISCDLYSCTLAQSELTKLLRFLGFYVAFDKLVSPSTCVTYLGIEIDSLTMELRLPPR